LWLFDGGYYVGCVYCVWIDVDFYDVGFGSDEVMDFFGGDDVVCYDWYLWVESVDGF